MRRAGQLPALLLRELWSTFCSALAWVVLALFLVVQGYGFYLYLELVNRPDAPHGTVLQYFFGGTFLYWLFVICVVSAVTMRLVAEERRSGTLESVLTAPVSAFTVVLAKYLATVLLYAALWLPTLVYVWIVARFAPRGLSLGPTLAGYLGTLAVGATCLAIGLLASAVCRSQAIAALLSCCSLSLLLLLGGLELFVRQPTWRAVLEHVNLFEHMEEFARGIIDMRRLVFYASVILFCLVAASRAVELRR